VMRQRILFAKIAGQGTEKTTAKVLDFLRRASAEDIGQFLERLRHNRNPPLLYCCEYLDYWSTGQMVTAVESKASYFCWSLSKKETDLLLYYFYPFTAQEIWDLLDPVKKWPNPADETRWFLESFQQCLFSWEGLLKGDSAVLLVRSVVGGTLLDEEILANASCDLF